MQQRSFQQQLGNEYWGRWPVFKPRCRLARRFENANELMARNQRCAETQQMTRVYLAVDDAEFICIHHSGERQQCNFRRIGIIAKHGFTEKDPSDSQPVQPADERSFLPYLHGMRPALAVQSLVGRDHVRCDPCSLTGSSRRCAGTNDIVERSIESHFGTRLAEVAAQASRQVIPALFEDATRIRRPPQDRLPILIPREDAVAVCI